MADGSLVFDTKIDTSGFKKGIDTLGKVGTKGLNVVTKGFKAVTSAMVATGVAVAGVGAASIKVGMDFEKGMSQVKAISGATEKEMAKLTSTAKELGATTQFSAAEAAAGMEFLAMAGYEVNEITKSMPGLLDLAAAGQMDLARAADVTTNIMSGFGLEAKETGRVADVLAKAASTANTDISQLGEAMKYVGPIANSLGLSIEETSAAVGVLSNAGIQGGQAGTVLRAGLTRLANPTGKAAELISDLGIEMFDANGKMKDMPGVISELEKGLAGMSDEQRAVTLSTIFGQQAMSGWTALLDAGSDSLSSYTADLENAEGAAADMAATMNDNLKGDLTLTKSALEGIGIAIYESVVNPLRKSIQWFNSWLEAINGALLGTDNWRKKLIKATGATGKFKKQIEALPNGAKGVAAMFGLLIDNMLSNIAKKFPEIADKAVEMVQNFTDGINKNSGSIGKSIANILSTFMQSISSLYPIFIETGANLLVNIITGMVNNIPTLIETIISAINSIIDTLGGMLPELLNSGKRIIMTILDGISKLIPDVVAFIVELITLVVKTIAKLAPKLLKTGATILKTLLKGIKSLIPEVIDAALIIIDAIVTFIKENLSEVLALAIEIIGTLVIGIYDALPALIEAAIEIILTLAEALIENIPILLEYIPQIVESMLGYLIESLPMLLEGALALIMTLVEGILENLPLIVEAAVNILNTIVEVIVNNLPMIIETAIEILLAIVEGIIEALPTLVDTIIELVSLIFTTIVDNLGLIINAAVEIIVALIQGIVENLPKLIAKIPTILIQIAGAIIKNLPTIIKAAGEIIMALLKGIFELVPTLLKGIFDIVVSIGKGFLDMDWVGIGKDILKGLWNGMKGLGKWLMDKVLGLAKNLTNKVKNFFGINSPSKLFQDEVGENLSLGIAVGLSDGVPEILDVIKKDMPDVTATVNSVLDEGQYQISGPKYNPSSTERFVMGTKEEFALAGNVNTVIEIDGREVARATTPYTSEELELRSKRRR